MSSTNDRQEAGESALSADDAGSGFVRCPFCDAILPPGSVIGTGPDDRATRAVKALAVHAQAADDVLREYFTALCDAAGIEHEGRANFYLLDDLLDHIGGPGTAEARWERLRAAHEKEAR